LFKRTNIPIRINLLGIFSEDFRVLYLDLSKEIDPILHWFNGEEGKLWVAVGADGAPFGKEDSATGRLV